MTNTKAEIEIKEVIAGESIKSKILIIKEQPVFGGGISQSKEENIILDANIIYEF